MLPGMTVKDGKETLTMDARKWHHDGMGVFHEPSWAFGFCDGTFEGELIGESVFFACADHYLSARYVSERKHGYRHGGKADWEIGATLGSRT